MARGVTKRTTWKPGDPRAIAASKKSSHNKLSEELKFLRSQAANDIEVCAYKYIKNTVAELKEIYASAGMPFLDMIIIRTLIKGLELGDFGHLESIFARSLGKVQDKLEIKSKVESYHQLTVKYKDLSYEELREKYFAMMKNAGSNE